jgi:hypothetical protein
MNWLKASAHKQHRSLRSRGPKPVEPRMPPAPVLLRRRVTWMQPDRTCGGSNGLTESLDSQTAHSIAVAQLRAGGQTRLWLNQLTESLCGQTARRSRKRFARALCNAAATNGLAQSTVFAHMPTCCLTFEFTRVRKRAKPAVALRVQRRVRRHGHGPWRGECRKYTLARRLADRRSLAQ